MKAAYLGYFLFPLAFICTASADTVVPDSTETYFASASDIEGNISVSTTGRLRLAFSGANDLAGNVANNGTIGDFSSDTTTFSGAISGTGVFYKEGAGTTIFTGSNSYTGPTVINAGVLQTGTGNVISRQSAVYVNGNGTLDLNNFQQALGSLTGNGTVYLGYADLPDQSGLVRNSAGKLVPGANSGFSGVTAGDTITINGSTITSGGSLNVTPTSSGGTIWYPSTGVIVTAMIPVNVVNVMNVVEAPLSTPVTIGATLNTATSGTCNTVIVNPDFTVGAVALSSGSVILSGTGLSGQTLNLAAITGSSTLVNNTGNPITIGTTGIILENGQTYNVNGWQISGTNFLQFTGTSGTIGQIGISGTNTFSATVGGTAALPGPGPMLFAAFSFTMPDGNGVLITGNDNTNRNFSGSISGNGSVIKVGTGAWNLTGSNSYAGLTTVADGALYVNGSVDSDVYVWGGVLGGSGRIGGNVLNQAVVSPGNSPGTLTIAGDYAQSSSGFLIIQIASPTVFDKLVVNGQASLDGNVLVQYLNGFKLKRTDAFTFLTAGGGVNGQFSQLFFPTGTMLTLQLAYQANSVTLVPFQNAFAAPSGLTPNQYAVAVALDRVVDRKGVSKLVDALDSLPLASVPGAFEKIVPTELLALFDASFASAAVHEDNLERRMEELRGGATGVSTAGLHLSNAHGGLSSNGNPDRPLGKDGKELSPAPLSERWGFFINGSGEFVDSESTAIARGTDFTTGGISAGADYRLCDGAAAGVTTGYSNTSTNGRGSVKADSGKLGVYATAFDRGFFFNGMLGGGLSDYDTRRHTLGGTARGSTQGNELHALLGTGYTCRKGGWSMGPTASLRYGWVGMDGFTERGSLAPLRFGDQSEESLKSAMGLQASYSFRLGKIALKPQLRAQWQHEYLDAARSIGGSFLPGGAFTVSGPEIGRDSLLLDAGLLAQLTARLGIYAFYTGDLGRENYTLHSVNGGVQFSF